MGRKILNLVNFVRGIEPRTNVDLYGTVVEQIKANKEENCPNTFLLQYDAMQRDDFRELFLKERDENMELGVWFENCRELIESLGLTWEGRPGYDWDWYIYPGFLEGYDPAIREKIVDAVFEKFKEIFGEYPAVAGSWVLDSYSMRYMCKKYGMKAFCVCREQYAVDAYTLWGGYYNGGYYASTKNMLSPAQTEEYKIPAPMFRMLGIDPVVSYDKRSRDLGEYSGCCTIEPVYVGGKKQEYIDWYFETYYDNPSLSHAHMTTGQENPFGWNRFGEGYLRQLKTISKWRKSGKLQVEKLGETGEWYQKTFRETPPAALCATRDPYGFGLQSFWYDCKNYRANFFFEAGKVRIRDITKFDERYEERYLYTGTKTFDAWYDNLPVVDGCLWYSPDKETGVQNDKDVASVRAEEGENALIVFVEYKDGSCGKVVFGEEGIVFEGDEPWRYETGAHDEERSLFSHGNTFVNKGLTSIRRKEDGFIYEHRGFTYEVEVFADVEDLENGWKLIPKDGKIEMFLNKR